MIGVGLIGGSFAIDIKKNNPKAIIHGISRKEETLNKALELKLIDKKATLDDLENADLVIVSIPVDATVKLLPTILDKISETGLVVDAGSTKEAICKVVEHHPKTAEEDQEAHQSGLADTDARVPERLQDGQHPNGDGVRVFGGVPVRVVWLFKGDQEEVV